MANRGLEGRKVALFIVLVVAGLACLGVLIYSLTIAKPRTDPQIQKGDHSYLRHTNSSARFA